MFGGVSWSHLSTVGNADDFSLPRDALRKRGILVVGRCLSVRLSHLCVVSKRLKIIKLLSHSGSPIILVS